MSQFSVFAKTGMLSLLSLVIATPGESRTLSGPCDATRALLVDGFNQAVAREVEITDSKLNAVLEKVGADDYANLNKASNDKDFASVVQNVLNRFPELEKNAPARWMAPAHDPGIKVKSHGQYAMISIDSSNPVIHVQNNVTSEQNPKTVSVYFGSDFIKAIRWGTSFAGANSWINRQKVELPIAEISSENANKLPILAGIEYLSRQKDIQSGKYITKVFPQFMIHAGYGDQQLITSENAKFLTVEEFVDAYLLPKKECGLLNESGAALSQAKAKKADQEALGVSASGRVGLERSDSKSRRVD